MLESGLLSQNGGSVLRGRALSSPQKSGVHWGGEGRSLIFSEPFGAFETAAWSPPWKGPFADHWEKSCAGIGMIWRGGVDGKGVEWIPTALGEQRGKAFFSSGRLPRRSRRGEIGPERRHSADSSAKSPGCGDLPCPSLSLRGGEKREDRTGVEHGRPLFLHKRALPAVCECHFFGSFICFSVRGRRGGPTAEDGPLERDGQSRLFSPYRGPFREAAAGRAVVGKKGTKGSHPP